MENKVFLGIDTSNYTTSLAAVSCEGEIIANLKAPLPVKEGERGLRQSDAVFAHVKNLPSLFSQLGEITHGTKIAAVGYSYAPRDCEGSYMPCFLSGEAVAYAVAFSAGVPIYKFSHQAGHVRAAVHSSGMQTDVGDEFIAFHVSGGTTEVLHVKVIEHGYDIERLGGTCDISAGQAIDRIGVSLGMSFPCGRELEAAALEFSGKIKRTGISVNGLNCNLSGLENIAKRMQDSGSAKEEIAAFTLDFITRTLVKLTDAAIEMFPHSEVLYSGGVMSNSIIKNTLYAEGRYFAEPLLSADNAAGTALLCRDRDIARG